VTVTDVEKIINPECVVVKETILPSSSSVLPDGKSSSLNPPQQTTILPSTSVSLRELLSNYENARFKSSLPFQVLDVLNVGEEAKDGSGGREKKKRWKEYDEKKYNEKDIGIVDEAPIISRDNAVDETQPSMVDDTTDQLQHQKLSVIERKQNRLKELKAENSLIKETPAVVQSEQEVESLSNIFDNTMNKVLKINKKNQESEKRETTTTIRRDFTNTLSTSLINVPVVGSKYDSVLLHHNNVLELLSYLFKLNFSSSFVVIEHNLKRLVYILKQYCISNLKKLPSISHHISLNSSLSFPLSLAVPVDSNVESLWTGYNIFFFFFFFLIIKYDIIIFIIKFVFLLLLLYEQLLNLVILLIF
jgi:hypothetical protein